MAPSSGKPLKVAVLVVTPPVNGLEYSSLRFCKSEAHGHDEFNSGMENLKPRIDTTMISGQMRFRRRAVISWMIV
jgi:hypothetical protein